VIPASPAKSAAADGGGYKLGTVAGGGRGMQLFGKPGKAGSARRFFSQGNKKAIKGNNSGVKMGGFKPPIFCPVRL